MLPAQLAIIRAIEHNSISSIEDVHDICLGVYRKQIAKISRHQDVTFILRKAKVIIAKKPDPGKNRAKELLVINEMLKASKELYEKQVQTDPFSDVPSSERSLLEDIHELSGASEKEILRGKLSDLASAIKIREETQKKFIDDQGQSLKIAKRGFFATLTMSGISIALAIWFFLLSRSSG